MMLGAALACSASLLAHANIDVGAGSSVSFADGGLDLGCSHLSVEGSATGGSGGVSGVANVVVGAGGSFAPGAGRLTLGGDFSNAGTFTPGTSTVDIVDVCGGGTSAMSGGTAFYDLAVVTTSGKRLLLPAQLTQSISHALTLQGAPGELLQVSSSSAGQQALLDVSAAAAQSVAYVNARDDKGSGATIAPGSAASHQSVDAGNLTNWFTDDVGGPGSGTTTVAPAPTLSLMARLALLIGILLLAWQRRRFATPDRQD